MEVSPIGSKPIFYYFSVGTQAEVSPMGGEPTPTFTANAA